MNIQMQSAQPHTSMCFGFLLGLFFTIKIFLQIAAIPIGASWSAGFAEKIFKLLINSCICSFVRSCLLPFVLRLLKAAHRAALSCQSLLLPSVAGQAKTTLVWIILLLQCRSCHEEWLREGKKKREWEGVCVCAQIEAGKVGVVSMSKQVTESSAQQGFCTGSWFFVLCSLHWFVYQDYSLAK